MVRRLAALIAVAGMVGAACSKGTVSDPTSGSASNRPEDLAIVQANFVDGVDNPWFPLAPGTTFTYEGTKDGQAAVDVFEVTSQTRVVNGVKCVVVKDTLTLDGKLHERTEDWYVQDRLGNVWYFGEATSELDDTGKVISTEGSWEAGSKSARPGIFMPADPLIGASFQQEFSPGQAEDHFVVLQLAGTAKAPYGTFRNALVTAEWTPLEVDVLGEKFYAKGVGLVTEADVAGSNERLDLSTVVKP
jgi:hypothetical protein